MKKNILLSYSWQVKISPMAILTTSIWDMSILPTGECCNTTPAMMKYNSAGSGSYELA